MATQCDAYHEAGHAIVGIIVGFGLIEVVAEDAPPIPPHCSWDDFNFVEDPNGRSGADTERAEKFTIAYAKMAFAAEFAEKSVYFIEGDAEAINAIHCDYLDVECRRRRCGFHFFGLNGRQKLRRDAFQLVSDNLASIDALAAQLLNGATLNHDQVVAIIRANNPETHILE